MDTSEPTGDFYERDLAYGEETLGELFEHEAYTLKITLPLGLTYREADTLAHRIVIETAERYDGAADFGILGREFDSRATALLSRKPGTTVSGSPYALDRPVRPPRD
ncbi:hypothetical protein [Glycomyces salinus]|uniref:hypothetical protein n=1 Tax=Glycomyces salinus TaxID=980294 RepID=UPI0018EA4E80|nr:hypothetical protein [Glycomyces salinus]